MIDPVAMADAGGTLSGELPLSECGRIVAEYGPQTGAVSYVLAFGRDEEGLRYVRGALRADVQVECSRCLAPLRLTLEPHPVLGIVADEAAAGQLPERYDPLVASGPMPLPQLLEEELLLALPLAPVHPGPACGDDGEVPADTAERTGGPFAMLATLRRGGRQGD